MAWRVTECVCVLLGLVLMGAGPATAPVVRVRGVNRMVGGYKDAGDFTTPERAYAALARRLADGRGDLRVYAAPELAARADVDDFAPEGKVPTEAERRGILTTQILEVHTFGAGDAAVVARLVSGWIDVRYLRLIEGRWLISGDDRAVDLDGARRRAAEHFSVRVLKPVRPRVADPAGHLQAYVDYLKGHGAEPKQAVLDALKGHKLTIIGEVHHRPTYWGLNAEVVKDPAFSKLVSTIFLELPSNDQELVDQFLEAKAYDPGPVVATLRDVGWTGWPDQAMVDFFKAVWGVNHGIHPGYRLRVRLVDMPRPWAEWRSEADVKAAGKVDRDELMAVNIQNDFRARHGDPRHALFVVGLGHAAKGLPLAAEPSMTVETAGERLAKGLGAENVYAFVQHGPAVSEDGVVFGRAALGMFDAAFAANGGKAVAFALTDSPFGGERYDMDAEVSRLTNGTYAEAFDGCIFLGALEDESYSAIVPGFYTEEFAKEVVRRHGIVDGAEPLTAVMKVEAVDGKAIERWMGERWGKSREWGERLGSVDAWKEGD